MIQNSDVQILNKAKKLQWQPKFERKEGLKKQLIILNLYKGRKGRWLRLKKKKILCIGDIILDTYSHGLVERISPEAPIPVI